jgi:hypothetical protein
MIMRKPFRINGRFRTVDLRRSPFSRYDFFLYGVVTGLVFAKLFFPKSDPLVGTLEAFAIYAVGEPCLKVLGNSTMVWHSHAPIDRHGLTERNAAGKARGSRRRAL